MHWYGIPSWQILGSECRVVCGIELRWHYFVPRWALQRREPFARVFETLDLLKSERTLGYSQT